MENSKAEIKALVQDITFRKCHHIVKFVETLRTLYPPTRLELQRDDTYIDCTECECFYLLLEDEVNYGNP